MESVDDATLGAVLSALGLRREQLRASQWLTIGPKWLGLLLDSADSVLALQPDHGVLKNLADVGVVGPHAPGSECQFELRGFAPADGIDEDPVTGSLNAGVAQWLIGAGLAPVHYLAAQGQCLGRAGRIHIEQEGRTVWVGGHSVSCIQGQVTL
jgi:PhzF family phenazine biosynthesis protein